MHQDSESQHVKHGLHTDIYLNLKDLFLESREDDEYYGAGFVEITRICLTHDTIAC